MPEIHRDKKGWHFCFFSILGCDQIGRVVFGMFG